MPNRHRGDAEIMIRGRRHTLRLTLGALAELEGSLGAADLQMLGERLAGGRFSATDLRRLLAAGLSGAGEPEAEALASSLPASSLPDAIAAVTALLSNTFGEGACTRPSRPQAA
jgi:hypothetical protein